MTQYNVLDWYWILRGEPLSVWSSRRLEYVTSEEAEYQTWLQRGNQATTINSRSELAQVIIDQYLPLAAQHGLAVVCSSNDSLSGTYAIDDAAIGNITSLASGIAAGKPLPSGSDTFTYRDINYTTRTFTAPQFLAFASAIEAYVYGFREAISDLILGNQTTLPIPTQPVTFS